ncbi:putative integrase [Trichinella spiralis]|uniref:putative integrase n=1 Tax=Trichinella spiralis TaxID=6334 RepID=UPI0001EFD590|nr:putative integrase [Trichinella spiralis]
MTTALYISDRVTDSDDDLPLWLKSTAELTSEDEETEIFSKAEFRWKKKRMSCWKRKFPEKFAPKSHAALGCHPRHFRIILKVIRNADWALRDRSRAAVLAGSMEENK